MMYHVSILPDDTNKGTPYIYDTGGVIKSKIPYTQEYHYHVTAIASRVLSGDIREREPHLRWLLSNMDEDGAYHHDFIFPFYPMERGWVGGLAQALATSALLYCGYETQADRVYSAMKNYCFNGCSVEEFPSVEILNGWIYALFAMYDMHDTSFFDENIQSLKDSLSLYDMGRWSRYDEYDGFPCTLFYHMLHVEQLSALYGLTKDVCFKELADKWSRFSWFDQYWAMARRYRMILKKHGVSALYERYKMRKGWMDGC